MRRGKRGMIKRVPRGIPGVYRFKRLLAPIRIFHRPADAANIWQIEDPNVVLNPANVSGVGWPGESLPGTYQNQFGVRHALNQVASPTDFTNLYDRYKITGVKMTFLYQNSDAGMTGAGVLPTIMYAQDYDDAAPPGYTALRSKQNVKQRILTANSPFSIFYRPKLCSLVQQGNASGVPSASLITAGFLNCEFPAVDHFGLKFSLNNLYGALGSASQLEIKLTYYLSFKDPQ